MMDRALKERIIGAVVLMVFVVLVVPIFLDGPPEEGEVVSERVLLPGLGTLLQPDARQVEERVIGGLRLQVPFYRFGEEKIWGATAMMLSELLGVIDSGRG